MVPQLKEVGPDVGQRARVLPHDVQVLLGQLPHGRTAALEQGRVVQVSLCRRKAMQGSGAPVPRHSKGKAGHWPDSSGPSGRWRLQG